MFTLIEQKTFVCFLIFCPFFFGLEWDFNGCVKEKK